MLYCGIPSINLYRYLVQTVESIKSNTGIKILLVDNLSTDGTREWIQQSSHEKILNPENYGVARSWNQILYWGLSHDNCEIIYILNNDIVLHPEAIDLMTESVLINGKEAISGLNIGSNPSMLSSAARSASRYSPSMNFCCFGLTPKTIKRVGFFDEAFKLAYFEDNDYHNRMRLEGIDNSCDMWALFSHYGSRAIKEGGVHHEPHFTNNRNYFKRKWGFDPV